MLNKIIIYIKASIKFNCIGVFILIILVLSGLNSSAQGIIISNKYNVKIKTYYDSAEIARINNFFDNKLQKMVLVRIKPHYEPKPIINLNEDKSSLREEKPMEIYESIIRGDSILPNMIEDSINLNDTNYAEVIRLIFTPDTLILAWRCGYEPKNGILLYGYDNKFLGFIEIGFKCHGDRYTGNLLPPVKISGKDYDDLKVLFEHYNISVD